MHLDFILHVNNAFLLIQSKNYKYSNCKMNYKKNHNFPSLDLTAINKSIPFLNENYFISS